MIYRDKYHRDIGIPVSFGMTEPCILPVSFVVCFCLFFSKSPLNAVKDSAIEAQSFACQWLAIVKGAP